MGDDDTNRKLVEAAKKIVEDCYDNDKVSKEGMIESLKLLRRVMLDTPDKGEYYGVPIYVFIDILELALEDR